MNATDIDGILGISESYQLPETMMEILLSDPVPMFQRFLLMESDLSHDWFTDYFQEQHSSRKSMMQDFTPKSLTDMVAGLSVEGVQVCEDVCAGTGGLTIAMWDRFPAALFVCLELSGRAFPLLLFNLAIRNMDAIAVRMDVLSQEVEEAFRLTPGEHFSAIIRAKGSIPEYHPDVVVMNPPYSLKHTWNEKEDDPRFFGYCYPPSQFSDYAFVLHGLYHQPKRLIAILPHGPLFRAKKEMEIRTRLVENGLMHTIIGLPDKLFLNTGIPVCIMVLQAGASGTLFVNAKGLFTPRTKANIMEPEHVSRVLQAVNARAEEHGFSHVASLEQIRRNNYNLNIPRYVDSFQKEDYGDPVEHIQQIIAHQRKLAELNRAILESMNDMVGDAQFERVREEWGKYVRLFCANGPDGSL